MVLRVKYNVSYREVDGVLFVIADDRGQRTIEELLRVETQQFQGLVVLREFYPVLSMIVMP